MKKAVSMFLLLTIVLGMVGCSKSEKETSLPTEWLASDGSVHEVSLSEQSQEEKALLNQNRELQIKHLMVDDIAVIEVQGSLEEDRPLLFMLHEQGGKKEDMLQLSSQFAESGFFCVLMDLPGYGERKQRETIESIEASVLATIDIDALIDYYRLQPGVDANRVALFGISMGGSAVYHYAAYGRRSPAAIVVACTSPDYTIIDNMGSITDGKGGEPSWSEPVFRKYAAEHNPLLQIDRLVIPAILSFNGLEDIIPIAGSQTLESRLREMGKTNMDFVYQEGVSHEMTPQFEERILPFLLECFGSVDL